MNIKKILIALTAFGVLAAFFAALPDELAGYRNRSYEIAVDFEDVRILAEDEGLSTTQALRVLKDAGVTALALREANVVRYSAEGRLAIFQGGEILNALRTGLIENPVFQTLRDEDRINTFHTYIVTEDILLAERLLFRLDVAFGRQARFIRNESPYIIEIKASRAAVQHLPIGIELQDIEMLKDVGLRIVGRPANIFMGTEAAMRTILEGYANLPEGMLSALVFDGIEAAGFPDYLYEAGEILRENGIKIGFIEYARRQAGMEELMRLTGYSGVTVHTNLQRRPAASVVNAVMERSVRLIHLRFHIEQRPANIEDAVEFVSEIRDRLARYGFYTGEAFPVRSDYDFPIFHILSILGVVAASGLTLIEMKLKLSRHIIAAMLLGFIILVGLYTLRPDFTLQMVSIITAIVFSTLAFVSQTVNRLPNKNVPAAGYVAMTLLRTVAVAVLGGILIAGLTSTPYFKSGAALFRGVTLSNTLPFIPVAWALYAKLTSHDDTEWNPRAVIQKLITLLKAHVTWLHVLIISAAALVLYVYVARMGHQAGMPLLPFEDSMRRFLDDILLVRPRTKEFLIAYPALILGLTLFARGTRTVFVSILITIGALAPISVTNTFMHFINSTLLSSSSMRTFNGLLLGACFGVILGLICPFALKIIKRLGV